MSLNKEYTQILIAGDFNHPDIRWTPTSDEDGEENIIPIPSRQHNDGHSDVTFIDCISDSLLQQHVTEPTRYRNEQNPTLDDLVFSNDNQTVSDLQYKSHLGNSDHIMLTFNTNFDFD